MEEKIEKTKVCAIFEPTYNSIMKLPSADLQLSMFINLCEFAFNNVEPKFGDAKFKDIDIAPFLYALWGQFKVAFDQSKKRARINSLNGKKGGRPSKKANENCEQEEKRCVENVEDDEIF